MCIIIYWIMVKLFIYLFIDLPGLSSLNIRYYTVDKLQETETYLHMVKIK